MNEKIYWTEANVGEVLVMDIELQKKRKLIVNHDGSTTRAIAVDPATRYIEDYCILYLTAHTFVKTNLLCSLSLSI